MSFERQLATPIVIRSDMDLAEFEFEWQRMKLRSQATSEFVQGRLELEDFLEALHEGGVDPFKACDDWSQGITYL